VPGARPALRSAPWRRSSRVSQPADGRVTRGSRNIVLSVGFLRRLLGGDTTADAGAVPAFDPAEVEIEEREHELEMLRGEQERLDELAQRQLRYAQHAWQPPAQGGERRADDRDQPET